MEEYSLVELLKFSTRVRSGREWGRFESRFVEASQLEASGVWRVNPSGIGSSGVAWRQI